jgi:hypothetical protein
LGSGNARPLSRGGHDLRREGGSPHDVDGLGSEERSAALARRAEAELRHLPDKVARAALHDAVRYAVTRRR